MRVTALLFGLILVSLLPSNGAAQGTHGPSDDWHVTEDTHLRNQILRVEGNVTVDSGNTLTLEGSTLHVGGVLHVRPNATLELLPSASQSTSRLLPHDAGDGFWVHVEGKMMGRGTPQIEGLWGNGLVSTLPGYAGGMQVSGYADLEGVRIHDGTAGLKIAEGGTVRLRGATVEHLGEVGITALGDLYLEETTVAHNEVNLIAKDTCDIRIDDSRFLSARFEQILVNGCKTEIHASILEGAGVGLVGNNAADILVQDSVIRDYAIDGLGSYASPNPMGGILRPTIRFHNVIMEPGPGAQRGADVSGNELVEFVNVTMRGHSSHGVQAQEATLSIRDSTITGNGGYGIHLTGGRFIDNPLATNNRFGSGDGDANAQGAVSHRVLVHFIVAHPDGDIFAPIEGEVNVTVRSADGESVPLLLDRASGPGTSRVAFEAYGIQVGGEPRFLGPFTYEATHPVRDKVFTGPIDVEKSVIVIPVDKTLLQTTAEWFVRGLSPLMFAVGAVLVLLGARVSVWPRIIRRFRARAEAVEETNRKDG